MCYGLPREAVNIYKRKHIYNTAKYYIYKNKLKGKFIRFDVVEIYITKNKYKLMHLKNVDINYWLKVKNIVKYFRKAKAEIF